MNAIHDEQDILLTTCRRTGRRCPAACGLVRHLVQAAKLACAAVPEFALTGRTRLEGCAATCEAVFALDADSVELFCGVDEPADMDALSDFSNAFLDDRDTRGALGRLDEPPAAFARASVGGALPACAHPPAWQA